MRSGPDIVTAFAESASGPGWANSPVWVIIREPGPTYRMVCLQPDEQTPTMRALYDIAAEVHAAMRREAMVALKGGRQ